MVCFRLFDSQKVQTSDQLDRKRYVVFGDDALIGVELPAEKRGAAGTRDDVQLTAGVSCAPLNLPSPILWLSLHHLTPVRLHKSANKMSASQIAHTDTSPNINEESLPYLPVI